MPGEQPLPDEDEEGRGGIDEPRTPAREGEPRTGEDTEPPGEPNAPNDATSGLE